MSTAMIGGIHVAEDIDEHCHDWGNTEFFGGEMCYFIVING